jgi:sugar/nucleoside kinase (ribokinase family)
MTRASTRRARWWPKARQIAVYKMGEKGAITITDDGEVATGIYRT